MLKQLGFSILEIMIAVAIVSTLGLGVYRLEIAQLAAARQALTRSLVSQTINNLVNQMGAHLNYIGTSNSAAILSGYSSSCNNASCYAETSYYDHTSSGIPAASASNCCSSSDCNDAIYAACVLSNWKRNLANMNLPIANIYAIVCRDSNLGVPTTISANCSSGDLVIKVVWQTDNNSTESVSLGLNNYLMLKVPKR